MAPRRNDRGARCDFTMTLRELSKDKVIEALGKVAEDSLPPHCRAALLRDPHKTFNAAESPAERLREVLEVNHRIARTKGKCIIGGDDLLLQLHQLGSGPVTAVAAEDGAYLCITYLRAWTLDPVGAVIIYDSTVKRDLR